MFTLPAAVVAVPARQVFAINALAPFILNSKLKPAMVSPYVDGTGATVSRPAFIVNVSAMEGGFPVSTC
jgi:NAD(P)-dependent dehydrogenase (short-subunit alcohol dehydrogenase family)